MSGSGRCSLLPSLCHGQIAKTCGHYDAYRKGRCLTTHLELALPVPVPEDVKRQQRLLQREDTKS